MKGKRLEVLLTYDPILSEVTYGKGTIPEALV
jgi:hypothetical protein